MRKYSTLRVKPLGRDRFYNRYYYLDNIGGGHSHGSGKLFVQSPSMADLSMLVTPTKPNTDETPTDAAAAATSLCGHGGGLRFFCQLMRHQGLADKASLLEHGIDGIINGGDPLEWWESFNDPDSVSMRKSIVRWCPLTLSFLGGRPTRVDESKRCSWIPFETGITKASPRTNGGYEEAFIGKKEKKKEKWKGTTHELTDWYRNDMHPRWKQHGVAQEQRRSLTTPLDHGSLTPTSLQNRIELTK